LQLTQQTPETKLQFSKYLLATVLALQIGVASAQQVVTQPTTDTNSQLVTNSLVTTKSDATTTVKSPPASAISPTINTSNTDLCTVGIAGAVQTQILGISAGSTVRDMNCERLKLSKTLYDMGMKVAAVSTLCQDRRVFDAMMQAGTPCPYDGTIGAEARAAWKANELEQPERAAKSKELSNETKTLWGGAGILGLLLLLLF
jgi:hypothetical protein